MDTKPQSYSSKTLNVSEYEDSNAEADWLDHHNIDEEAR